SRRHTSVSRDWSSDVCSSDLRRVNQVAAAGAGGGHAARRAPSWGPGRWTGDPEGRPPGDGRADPPAVRRRRRDAAAGRPQVPRAYLTRLTYSPERVSTLITSSCPTNSGTRTTAPVSSVAGLPPPPEVSPRTPGSVWVILSSTKFGGVTAIGVPFHSVTTQVS